MPAAQRSRENQIGGRSRSVDKMPRILDDDIRLVAISGQFGRDTREKIVYDAHDPSRAILTLRAGPFGDFVARHPEKFARRHAFVARTEWARLGRVANRLGTQTRRIGNGILAAAEREREALAAHIDNV